MTDPTIPDNSDSPAVSTEAREVATPIPTQPVKRKAALGTWAFVLGIIGILFAVIPQTSGFGIFLAIVALILGGIGLLLKSGRARIGTILGLVALILGITVLNVYGAQPGSLTSSDGSAAHSGSQSKPAKPAAPSKPVVPAGTTAELQALIAAKGYLSDGQGFSAAGLLGQLTSSAGDGFDPADAQWGIDHSNPDWNAQAQVSAKGYLADGQGFSQAGLTAQLTSASGAQFTEAQAEYGVAQSGADWNAQAVIAAKGYISDGEGFSHASLVEQLVSPEGGQFTAAQAEYGVTQAGL